MKRAEELGLALAAELVSAQEEEAAKAAKVARESSSPGRTPDPKRVNRRAQRSPSKDKEGKASAEEEATALKPVLEEGENTKVPSDEEEEEAEGDTPEEVDQAAAEAEEAKDL
eukprot:15022863-Heterocapsa_arctica.AAC.1